MSHLLEEYSKRKLHWQLKVSAEALLTYVRQQAGLFNNNIYDYEAIGRCLQTRAENVSYFR
jgi:hypothetical protein